MLRLSGCTLWRLCSLSQALSFLLFPSRLFPLNLRSYLLSFMVFPPPPPAPTSKMGLCEGARPVPMDQNSKSKQQEGTLRYDTWTFVCPLTSFKYLSPALHFFRASLSMHMETRSVTQFNVSNTRMKQFDRSYSWYSNQKNISPEYHISKMWCYFMNILAGGTTPHSIWHCWCPLLTGPVVSLHTSGCIHKGNSIRSRWGQGSYTEMLRCFL